MVHFLLAWIWTRRGPSESRCPNKHLAAGPAQNLFQGLVY